MLWPAHLSTGWILRPSLKPGPQGPRLCLLSPRYRCFESAAVNHNRGVHVCVGMLNRDDFHHRLMLSPSRSQRCGGRRPVADRATPLNIAQLAGVRRYIIRNAGNP